MFSHRYLNSCAAARYFRENKSISNDVTSERFLVTFAVDASLAGKLSRLRRMIGDLLTSTLLVSAKQLFYNQHSRQ